MLHLLIELGHWFILSVVIIYTLLNLRAIFDILWFSENGSYWWLAGTQQGGGGNLAVVGVFLGLFLNMAVILYVWKQLR